MIKLSAVVTCYNNQETIEKCINSLAFVDEIIVLDSYSDDKTMLLLETLNCKVKQQSFKGYSRQKQDVINLATHDWVLLLDSDEFLTTTAQSIIKDWQQKTPLADAYARPRREWVFWQWSHKWVHMNTFVRLFNKSKARMSDDIVHESVKSSGKISSINAVIKHFGETSIAVKLEKIHKYAELAAQQKFQKGKTVSRVKIAIYPIWYFFKQYVMRRQIFNGKAGFINAKLNTKYARLKYLNLYDLQNNNKVGF
jgi:glycosyltransferase involved in cell wall biosynthesis